MVDMQNQSYLKFKAFWNQFKTGFPDASNFDAEQFVSYCNIQPQDHVLEIGMGGGNSLKLISEMTGSCIFTDFHWNACKTQKKIFPQLIIIKADGIQLPFKSRSFDKIVARYVIHNFPDHAFRTEFYKEMERIINDNGELILGKVPNKTGMFFDLRNYIDPKFRHRLAKRHFMFWPLSIRKMKKELYNLGFQCIHIRKTPEPGLENIYYKFRCVARKFFLTLFYNNPIIYDFIDLKFKKTVRKR